MTDPERFLDGGRDDLEAALLSSALPDAGSEASYRRVQLIVAAGAAGGVLSGTGSASAATVAASNAKLGVPALIAKWLTVGVVAGAFVGGVAVVVAPEAPERGAATPSLPLTSHASPAGVRSQGVDPPPAAENVVSPSRAGASPSRDEPSEVAPVLGEEVPRPVLRAAGSARAEPGVTAPTDPEPVPAASTRALPPIAAVQSASAPETRGVASTLGEEVALVDAARAALARRDASVALGALSDHARRFPAGSLSLDVAVLRVQALLLAGRRPEAEREGARVLAAHPSGPYATRVTELLRDRSIP